MQWFKILTLSPDKTIQLNGPYTLFHLSHVRFIIPGLDVQQDRRLGDYGGLCMDQETTHYTTTLQSTKAQFDAWLVAVRDKGVHHKNQPKDGDKLIITPTKCMQFSVTVH